MKKIIQSDEIESTQPIACCSYPSTTINDANDDDFNVDNSYYENNSLDSDYQISSDTESTDDEPSIRPKKYRISQEILKKIQSNCNFHTSYEDMSKYIKIGIEIAGGNPDDNCLSKSQIHKQLSELRDETRTETPKHS